MAADPGDPFELGNNWGINAGRGSNSTGDELEIGKDNRGDLTVATNLDADAPNNYAFGAFTQIDALQISRESVYRIEKEMEAA